MKYDSIVSLPQGARVGTSSLRRQAQIKAQRPDLDIHPLRGNVDTRVRKLEHGEYDAIILAFAGLNRLGKTQFVKEIISEEVMCPAAGQGALGIEIRIGDTRMREILSFPRRSRCSRHHDCGTRAAESIRRRLPSSDRRVC